MRHPFHGRQLQGRHVAARNINVLEHINIDWRDALDITVVGVLLYQVIQMLRGSRALTVLTGLGLLTLLFGILAAIMWVTRKMDWYALSTELR